MLLRLRNIKVMTVVGVHEWERTEPRPLNVSLLIDFDHSKAVASDLVEDTFDYSLIENGVVLELAGQKFQLLESVAEHIAKILMANDLVTEVTVEVEKPGIMRFAESVSVIHTVGRG